MINLIENQTEFLSHRNCLKNMNLTQTKQESQDHDDVGMTVGSMENNSDSQISMLTDCLKQKVKSFWRNVFSSMSPK